MRFICRRPALLAFTTLALLANCTNDLTRAKALAMLNKDALQPITNVAVTNEAYDLAKAEGFYEPSGEGQAAGKASQYFDRYWWFAGAATLKVPLKRRAIEVTGITDGPMGKETKAVQFTWEYVDVPDPVTRYTGTIAGIHSAEAAFKLYDDGWRIEGLR